MKLVLLVAFALCQTVLGQFGGRQQCDIQRLSQVAANKERCFKDVEDLVREGMRAIQRSDPTCNEGMAETCERCADPVEQFQKANDLDSQGVFDCCFQGRMGGFGGSNRQCEFMSKPMLEGHGKHGGKHGGGRGGGRGGHRGPPPPPGMADDKEMMKQMMTLGSLGMMAMSDMSKKICKTMKWCKNEDRMINQRAIPTAKEYGDKITAKIFECYTPMMDVATNCTDLQPDDLECIMKGYAWSMKTKEACLMVCGPDTLGSFCNMFMAGASQSGNQQFNMNTRQDSSSTNQQNNNYYDPFSFSSGRK